MELMQTDQIKRRIGIMGGTFNPVHMGHLILAENAYEQFQLDKVLFMPSKNPPHKLHTKIIADQHRLEMVRLAVEDNPKFEASSMELEREGITYTKDTLKELVKEHPDTEYYFIIGADSLFQIETWMNPSIIFDHAHIVAASRYRISQKEIENQILYLRNAYQAKIDILSIPNIDISSNYIRTCICDKKTIRYYVPKAVELYIKKYELYREREEQ